MPVTVTLVRHGRSESNEANVWQGQGDSPLSAEGREQAKKLASRLDVGRFDVVIASDLSRAVETAESTGAQITVDHDWREMDLGSWEGRSFEEVSAEHPDLLQAIRRGEAIRFGETGETIGEFEKRIWSSFDALVHSLGSDGSALVVSHGGVIDALVGRALGRVSSRRTFPIVTNTSLTVFSSRPQARSNHAVRLQTFNDATHLGQESGALERMRRSGTPVLGLVRHAVSGANKVKRIQGRSCWGLDNQGRHQAAALSEWYGEIDRVFTSPTQRAVETAEILARGRDLDVDDDLVEMSFGEWEGQLYDDVFRAPDGLAAAVFADGQDLPRGRTGETFAAVADRMMGFIRRVDIEPLHRTVAVTHGAAIKTLIGAIHERGYEIVDGLATPLNSSVSHIALTDEGPMLIDFSVAPHMGVDE
jgi:probable phosphoglycerate mutase